MSSAAHPTIRFCRSCGAPTAQALPDDGDTRERAICTSASCKTIHYQNPLNVVGTIPHLEGRVLLCKRNIEPRWGKWTLPAGFMELGETVQEGAARETMEEAGAQFEMEDLITVISVPKVSQVHMYFRARLTSDIFDPGHETLEARLFSRHDIPWDELAFQTVRATLERFFYDLDRQQRNTHHFSLS